MSASFQSVDDEVIVAGLLDDIDGNVGPTRRQFALVPLPLAQVRGDVGATPPKVSTGGVRLWGL